MFATPTPNINNVDYVVTEKGITYVVNLRHGINNNLTAKTETGEKIVFNLEDVKAYKKDGKEFQSKYFVEEGSQTVRKTFLQKVYTRAGYSLYKRVNKLNGGKEIEDFYVYNYETQEYKINKENYKVILCFFFPKYNLMYSL